MNDLTGQRFGRLIVIHPTQKRGNGGNIVWKCQCDCGNTVKVSGDNLKRGHTKSCGCFQREAVTTHGKRYTFVYKSWAQMKTRCLNPDDIDFKNYGARGITVCNRWLKFENFLADMGERAEGLTLGRINNNKGYSPDNCEWQTYKQQGNNRRDNVIIEYKGFKFSIAEWARKLGINDSTLRSRIKNLGWPIERAFNN